jgi:hypothetical protein
MGFTTLHYGRPSYTVGNGSIDVYSSVQGGHTTASFKAGGAMIFPYFVAPWWKEAPIEGLASTMQVMRGNYFCFPFGVNAEPVNGKLQPLHGVTANECWDFDGVVKKGKETTLTIRMELTPDDGEAQKIIRIVEGHPAMYINHLIKGFSGRSSVGNHPCIQCSDTPGSAYIDLSEPLAGFTPPIPLGTPDKMGYYLLKCGEQFADRRKVLTVHGDTADLTRYPLPRGYEDAAMFISDPANEFCFASVSVPEKGFLYFQLKDPKVLRGSLFWMPNGGSYNEPLNGRLTSVIGLDEITGNFFYGRKPSMDPNPISEKGYETCLEFSAAKPTEIKSIEATVPIGKNWKGVKDIVRKDGSTLTILGRGGERMDIPCYVDFLKG